MLPRVYLYTPPIFNFVKSTVIGTLEITRLFILKTNHVVAKKNRPQVLSNKIIPSVICFLRDYECGIIQGALYALYTSIIEDNMMC